ncbi:MAG: hypothetical protein FWG63_11530 [Defluviitaleaceae bacterium]|nr:hypothetical protein [Defluviitaleaceae bacterium]
MIDNLTTIDVDKISEYSTDLGNRCHLMKVNGLSPYTNTEEELMDFLVQSAKIPSNFDICKSSRCGDFWREYEKGVTPFLEKELITMNEYNGFYKVSEGKHRTCMAIRGGVKTMQARVYEHNDNENLIASVGSCGSFHFSIFKIFGRIVGSAPVLFVDFNRCKSKNKMKIFDRKFTVIDDKFDTKGKFKHVLDGLKYKVTVKKRWLDLVKSIDVEIIIDENHFNTKIWLLKSNLSQKIVNAQDAKTLYRYGYFRKYHERANFEVGR